MFGDYVAERLNLYDFDDESLEVRSIDGEDYRLDSEFEPSVILGQAFGSGIDKDSYNNVLAETISAAESFYDETPVIAQSEIVDCLEERQGYDASSDDLFRVFENSGAAEIKSEYSTAEVLEEAYDTVLEEGYDPESALLVGHNAHMQRIVDTAEEVGFEGQPMLRDEVEWPENDGQKWVRSPEKWHNREIATRAHHWAYFNVPGAKWTLNKIGL